MTLMRKKNKKKVRFVIKDGGKEVGYVYAVNGAQALILWLSTHGPGRLSRRIGTKLT